MARKLAAKPLLFGSLATAFEWYDYALFGYFAAIIGQQFYPSHDPITSLLATFAVFASGFAMRPLGAIFYGYIGDRVGRKYALAASLLMMAAPTTLLGVLPTYETIGVFASIGLVIIRLLQGLAVGGNYGGSFIFVIEHAPEGRQGFAGSLASFGTLGGLFLGSGAATLLTHTLSSEDLHSFGWRIPFLLGSLSAVVGYMIRKYVPEQATEASSSSQLPVKEIWQNYRGTVLRAMGIILLDGVGVYILFVFMTTFATLFLRLPEESVLFWNTLSMGSLVISIPFFGWLGDKIGAKKVLWVVSLGFLSLAYPLYSYLIESRTIESLALLQMLFSILMGAAYGTLPVVVSTAFPHYVRYTAAGLSFNISVACFGGTAPFLVTSLIEKMGNLYIPAIMIAGVGLISLICLPGIKTRE
ncbi:MAG: MFS transporter [Candidatus Paracaedibacteraceae bacterium]|nr:MFS transporter [Candidatus Paracaedibacteraceae bacterium]